MTFLDPRLFLCSCSRLSLQSPRDRLVGSQFERSRPAAYDLCVHLLLPVSLRIDLFIQFVIKLGVTPSARARSPCQFMIFTMWLRSRPSNQNRCEISPCLSQLGKKTQSSTKVMFSPAPSNLRSRLGGFWRNTESNVPVSAFFMTVAVAVPPSYRRLCCSSCIPLPGDYTGQQRIQWSRLAICICVPRSAL